MASLCWSTPFVVLSVLTLMVSPSHSATCTSQKLTKTYEACTDLPYLKAYLHYTYDAANSSLSIAFLAPATNSWVSWAINPTAVGMVGAQALMALKPASGSVVAKTFNISSYQSIEESKLSFEVWDLSAEESDGTIRLFGSVKVPGGATTLNQVWQVGSAVDGTHPKIHDLTPDNKKSKGTLKLVAATAAAPSPAAPAPVGGSVASSPAPVTTSTQAPAPASGASVTMLKGSIGVASSVLGMFLLWGFF